MASMHVRTVNAYRFPTHGDAHPFAVTVQYFNINHGFEHPVLNAVIPPPEHANRYQVRMPDRDVVFYFYVTRGSRANGPNRSLLDIDDTHPWFGEIIVLRRAKYFDGFVHFRQGDSALAKRAVPLTLTVMNSSNLNMRLFELPICVQRPGDQSDPYFMRYLLIIVTLRGIAPNAVVTEVTWQEVKSSTPCSLNYQYYCVNMRRPPNVDVWMLDNPFLCPSFIYYSHGSFFGRPLDVMITLQMVDWQTSIAIIADIQFSPTRNRLVLDPLYIPDSNVGAIEQSTSTHEDLSAPQSAHGTHF
ncbi:hypothetical protein C8Q73DRAFT_787535 [Cubamyces lactineus]|nr:hypothetical protein C8Q73DRAFT_787535 [Cubamyces lactineus]